MRCYAVVLMIRVTDRVRARAWKIPARVTPPAIPAAASGANNPFLAVSLAMGLGLLVVRFSMLNQMLYVLLNINPLLMYLFGIPTMVGVVLSGGIWRSFRGAPAYYWTAYALWMALVSPFSVWRSGSLPVVWGYWKVELPVLFVIAGLAITWRSCRMVMYAIAWSGVLTVAAGKFFRDPSSDERLAITFGTVANANDYACVLLLMIPFLLWMALSSKKLAVRMVMLVAVAAGIYMIVSTGSRGAAVGLLAEMLFLLFRGSVRQRIALLTLGLGIVVLAVIVAPKHLIDRILSFSTEDRGSQAEAAESMLLRQYTNQKALEYTLTHPITGVGPGQFSTYEGTHNTVVNQHGYWIDAHNSYLQVSCETGLPGLLFFVGGFLSTGYLLNKTYRKARSRPDCADIQVAALCIMLGMTGYCVGIAFLNFAYFFYGPALGGLAIAVRTAAEREFATRPVPAPGNPVLPVRTGSPKGRAWA